MLIIELYGIVGVINILLDVTFIMCCNVDLCMYSDILEECNINPGRDRS